MKQHSFAQCRSANTYTKCKMRQTHCGGGSCFFDLFLHLFYNLIRNHGERTPQDTNHTSLMLYRHRFSFQASLNWNPRISSSSSKVKVISMSNSPSGCGCSWISDGSGTSGCLILMAFNSANFDLGMSSSLQSSRVPQPLEAETMQVEKRMAK